MDASSQHWVNRFLQWVDTSFRQRFDAGQKKHGGRFYRKAVWHELDQEWLDLGAYIRKCQEDRRDALHFIDKALLADGGSEQRDWIELARAVLLYGNQDGEPEEELEKPTPSGVVTWDYTASREPGY